MPHVLLFVFLTRLWLDDVAMYYSDIVKCILLLFLNNALAFENCSFAHNNCRAECKQQKVRNRTEYKLKCFGISHIEDLVFKEEQVPFIHSLDLSNNNISYLPDFGLRLPELVRLDLDRNRIHAIGSQAFIGVPKLKLLRLSQNLLSSIPDKTFQHLNSLTKINLTGNALRCDCSVWPTARLQVAPKNIKISGSCVEPTSMIVVPLDKLKVNESECPYEGMASRHKMKLIPSNHQLVFEGDAIKLRCRVSNVVFTSQEDTANISWSPRDTQFSEGIITETKNIANEEMVETSLYIPSLGNHHNGRWNCIFKQGDQEITSSLQLYVIAKDTKYCPSIVTSDVKGVYYWPKTFVGHLIRIPCKVAPNNVMDVSYASQVCTRNGTWEQIDTSDCWYISEFTRIVQRFSQMNLTKHRSILLESASQLRNYTCDRISEVKFAEDADFLTETIERYLNMPPVESELAEILASVSSCLANIQPAILATAEKHFGVCERLINSLEAASKFSSNLDIRSDYMSLKVFPVMPEIFSGLSCTWYHAGRMNCSSDRSDGALILSGGNMEAAVHIPLGLFSQSEIEASPSALYHLVVSIFSDARLFPDKNGDVKKMSHVISITLPGINVARLDEPILVIYKNRRHLTTPKLLWWNEETSEWVENYCFYLATPSSENFRKNQLVYKCFRLGYFAMFVDKNFSGVGAMSKLRNAKIPGPIALTATYVATTCLAYAAFAYFYYYHSIKMNRKMKHSLINTWISIAAFMFAFAFGIGLTSHPTMCQLCGLLTHYLAISAFFWMAVTAKILYKTSQKFISQNKAVRTTILDIYLVGWGVGAILCGISGAVNLSGYGGEEFCFLSFGPALAVVLIPAFLILIYLLVVCSLIGCSIANENLSGASRANDLDLRSREFSSKNSCTTGSVENDNADGQPAAQFKAFVVVLVSYIVVLTSSAATVALHSSRYDNRTAEVIYALASIILSSFVSHYYCFARTDVRYAWRKVETTENFPPISTIAVSPPLTSDLNSDSNAIRQIVSLRSTTDDPDPDAFYNPNQNNAARKFFMKQRMRRSNIVPRKCRSGGSSPVSHIFTPVAATTKKLLPKEWPYNRSCEELNTQPLLPMVKMRAVDESSHKYDEVYSPRDYVNCSDVNSEPSYNYAFIDKTSSVCTSHVYASLASETPLSRLPPTSQMPPAITYKDAGIVYFRSNEYPQCSDGEYLRNALRDPPNTISGGISAPIII